MNFALIYLERKITAVASLLLHNFYPLRNFFHLQIFHIITLWPFLENNKKKSPPLLGWFAKYNLQSPKERKDMLY